MPNDEELLLFDYTTGHGVQVLIKRRADGTFLYLMRVGPTTPPDFTFPAAQLTADQFDRLLVADRTASLGILSSALAPDAENAIQHSLDEIADSLQKLAQGRELTKIP